ncbi:sensor histidine kinase [Krasilnikoviella flava]|uniref:sensor histidine kinase n=1 Tax=Krasilnikoviella flava TaxID=526729 RepID=UPI0015925294|nr:histidine kinase [Krasilnikoviella flava]
MTPDLSPATARIGGARGVELYTRVSLYLFVLFEPFFYLYAVAALSRLEVAPSGAGGTLLVVAALVHTSLCLATVHAGFDGPLWSGWRPRPVVLALLVATAALVVVTVATLPVSADGGMLDDPRSVMVAVGGAATCGALAVASPPWRVAGCGVVVAVTVATLRATAGIEPTAAAVLAGLLALVFTLFWAGTVRMSMWMVEVVRRLDDARGVAARLAVAEERLRIARDMHDVVGRALSAVAVKSELAAALARRGDLRGADQMDEVRTLAQESLREVRGVVAGYRAADLATELDGARSVLRAAGVTVRVVGDVPHLAAPQVEALAWVVREGVTNIVRHSDARECRIDLTESAGDDARVLALTVTNDGVRGRTGSPGGGAGLVGLRERLAAVGGSLDTATRGDRFVLTACVPAPGTHDLTKEAAA